MYIVDTNVISELRRARTGKANPNVLRWAEKVPAASLYLSVISILELETGVLSLERRDKQQGQLLRTWLDSHVLPGFSERVLPIDSAVAQCCARLHVPDRRSKRDALIAATASAHKMMVVTRNVGDFAGTKVPLLNPWEAN